MQRTHRNARYTHPRRLANMQAHFNSIVRIARGVETRDDFNQPTITYIDDPQLTTIRAYKEPEMAGTGENRQDTQTVVTNRWLVYLAGYYPTINTVDRAIVDGVPHNILNVMHDDSKTLTVLNTEIVNAGSDGIVPL